MAKTTFSGPVLEGKEGVNIETKSSNYTVVATTDSGKTFVSSTDGVVFTLPAIATGEVYKFVNAAEDGTNTLTINADGTDAWVTGSLIETRAADAVSYDTSTAGEGQLVFTAANATTNFFTIGSILYFSCTTKGLWHVGLDSAKDPLAVKGAFAWAA